MRRERPHVLLAMCQHEPGWTHEPRWPSAPTPADERRPRRSPPCRPTPPGVCGSIPLAGACGWRRSPRAGGGRAPGIACLPGHGPHDGLCHAGPGRGRPLTATGRPRPAFRLSPGGQHRDRDSGTAPRGSARYRGGPPQHDASGLRRARAARPRYALRWTVYVFPAPEGGPLHAEYWRDTVWRPAGARTGLTRMRPHDLKHAGVDHLAAAPASTRGRSRGVPVTRIPASPSPLRPPLPRGPPQRRSASSTLSADDCAQPTVSCGLLPRPRVITDSVPALPSSPNGWGTSLLLCSAKARRGQPVRRRGMGPSSPQRFRFADPPPIALSTSAPGTSRLDREST